MKQSPRAWFDKFNSMGTNLSGDVQLNTGKGFLSLPGINLSMGLLNPDVGNALKYMPTFNEIP